MLTAITFSSLSFFCVTTCSLCHDQRCHAEPLAPDALPGCHGETSIHQLWWRQGWKGTESSPREPTLSTPTPALQHMEGHVMVFHVSKCENGGFSRVPSCRWRCWSASLQCPCQMWCWVSMWGIQRVREMPNWVILMIPPFLKDRLKPPSHLLSSMCTTNAGMVTTPCFFGGFFYETNPTDVIFSCALALKFLLLRCSFHPPLWKSSEWEESWGAAAVHRCAGGHFRKSVSQERASGARAAQRGRLRQDDEQETWRLL